MDRQHFWATCLGILLVLGGGCEKAEPDSSLFYRIPASESGIHFGNFLQESPELNIITFEYYYNGAGVGIGDLNNDGLQDIVFSANQGNAGIYLNEGDLRFSDYTEKAEVFTDGKWGTGVSLVDINGDGWLDIYMCFAGPYGPKQRKNSFFINQQDGSFQDQAEEMGLADDGHSTQAAFFDYDLDGDLDLYLLTNIMFGQGPNVIRPKLLGGEAPSTDRLYENREGTFVDVSQEAGILAEGYGLGLSIRDINEDGWPDIYVSNDYLSNDLLYINQRDGTFRDQLTQSLKHTSYSAMGNDLADINNDGLQDIITVDMLPQNHLRRKLMFNSINYDRHRSELKAGYSPQYVRNTLQLNRGVAPDGKGPIFSEIGQLSGVHATDWSWAPLLADFDNDGWRDLMVTNGYPRDITNLDFVAYKMAEMTRTAYNPRMQAAFVSAIQQIPGIYLPNKVYANQGNLKFVDQGATWGFQDSSFSHGAAVGDLDNDGDLDIVIHNTHEPAWIMENTGKDKAYLRLRLKGPQPNPAGFGARVFLYASNGLQMQEVHPIRGFQSSCEPIAHFGLDSVTVVDSLHIIWPDGARQVMRKVMANQVLDLAYPGTPGQPEHTKPSKEGPDPLFSAYHDLSYQHQEQHFSDFHVQALIPQKYSQGGPGIAVGDVNGDGKEDVFIGGAFKQPGKFFLQGEKRIWEERELDSHPKYEEDMGSLLFDAEGDGDLDLYVVSGGNEFPAHSPYYRDRFYRNDGRGYFSLDTTAFSSGYSSGSCVVGQDIEGDGDWDLFVGGRLQPHAYPQAGESIVWENEIGIFKDVTDEKFPGLRQLGRVTSALWTDVNDDGIIDLLVVGEWMPISVFIGDGEKWTYQTPQLRLSTGATLEQTRGWWNSVSGGDFDQDGDTDYIVGNLGLNSPFSTSIPEPTSLYQGDFDGNGEIEAIICHYLEGVEAPFHPKDDMQKHIYDIRRVYPSYEAYAKASWGTFAAQFPSAAVTQWKADILESIYLENKGEGLFHLQVLPLEAQFAPVFGILPLDVNGDTNLDLILTGNSHATESKTGAYDAMTGCLLLGNGKGGFSPLKWDAHGFWVPGDGKSLALLHMEGAALLLAAMNDGPLASFSWNYPEGTWAHVRRSPVRIAHSSGKVEKRELYWGGSYLSQSSPSVFLPAGSTLIP